MYFKAAVASVWLLLFSFSAIAEDNWVQADGYAPMETGKLIARRQALVEAYRQAISAGGMVEVGGYSQMSNFAMVADVVNTRVHGYIKRYEVLSEGIDQQDSELYKITIKAQIVTAPDKGNEQGLSSFLDLIGKPKVLFLIADQQAAEQTSSVETHMAENFRKAGYDVLTADDVKRKKDITDALITKARLGGGVEAAKVARSVNADIVITGKVTVQMSEMSGGTDIKASMGNVSLNVKAIIPGNGSVLDVVNARDRFMSVQQSSEVIAREKAISKASKKVTDKMKWQIPKYLSQQPRSIQLELGQLSFDQIEVVKSYLSKTSGIDEVELDNWEDDTGYFTVNASYTGPKEMDVIRLIQTKYKTAKVKKLQNYQVALVLM